MTGPTGRKLLETWYRSRTPDGALWCESRDPDEVVWRSDGHHCTFEKLELYEVSDGWQPWTPADA